MNEETRAVQTETDDEWGDIAIDETDIVADEAEEPDAAPETDTADPQDAKGDAAETAETKPEAEKGADQFTLKHLDEVRTVSREEIIPLAQKGMDYDRVRQKLDGITAEKETLAGEKAKADETVAFLTELAKDSGFANADAFIDELKADAISRREGIDITLARGRVTLERREKALAEKERQTAEAAKAPPPEDTSAETEKRRTQEAAEFAAEYPDIKAADIPKEVWDGVVKGDSLLNAYRKFENAKLKAELASRKKAEENKAKSAGSRQTVGQTTAQDEIDKIWYDED